MPNHKLYRKDPLSISVDRDVENKPWVIFICLFFCSYHSPFLHIHSSFFWRVDNGNIRGCSCTKT